MRTCILTAAAMALTSLPAGAESPVPDNLVTATILPGWETRDGTRMAALRLDLAPGWKTYWRAPGEAGIPPVFNWAGSANIEGVTIHWPRPEVFLTNGMQTIGYHDTLVLPIEIAPQAAGAPVQVTLEVDLGICSDVCVPATVSVNTNIGPGGSADGEISAALADRPRPAAEAGLTAISCAVEPIRDGMRVTAVLDMPAMGGDETVVLENSQGNIWVSEAMTVRDGRRLTATADMVADSGAPFALSREDLRVTVLAGDRAVEVRGCPQG